MGRRNLLTTASNGSANGLQVISDRLADNFSILPGHHGTGDNGGDGDGGGDVGVDGNVGEVDEDEGDGGGIMAKSFAMFECGRRGSAVTVGAHERWEGARALRVSPRPPHTHPREPNIQAKLFYYYYNECQA